MNLATSPKDSASDVLTVIDHRSLGQYNILIFKTNIDTREKTHTILTRLINQALIYNWSIDLEDIDHVLRIEASKQLKEQELIKLIKESGFSCELLTD